MKARGPARLQPWLRLPPQPLKRQARIELASGTLPPVAKQKTGYVPFVVFAHTPAEPVAAEPVAAEPVAAEPVAAEPKHVPEDSRHFIFRRRKKVANFERPFTPRRWLRSA